MSAITRKQTGFTIVELLIVIVVIGILAAITIVAFNGIQDRARDTQRKNDLSQIAKALEMYNIDHGDYAVAGCGSNGTGWLNYKYSVTPQSTHDCLKNAGYFNTTIIDPSGNALCSGIDCHAYMKYTCSYGTYLYANLESVGHTTTDTDGTCGPSLDEQYGMNYVIKVN